MVEPEKQVTIAESGQTLAGALRGLVAGLSWAEARRLIAARRVRVNGSVCLDDARRLKIGDDVETVGDSQAAAPVRRDVRIVYADEHVVVVDKPAGVQTVRRIEELDWPPERKRRQPVLQEIVEEMLTPAVRENSRTRRRRTEGRVRAVHRLDRDTSGLMMFSLSAPAEQELVRRFAGHEIHRVYRAVVHGVLREPVTIETWLVRDRGDGLRGSAAAGNRPADAQRAITHVRPIEPIGNSYTLVECRLETGRTHQIRIHLAERGHMLCGEKVYVRPASGMPIVEDRSGAPRQALHSAELQFEHPVTHEQLRFESLMPRDLSRWVDRMRKFG